MRLIEKMQIDPKVAAQLHLHERSIAARQHTEIEKAAIRAARANDADATNTAPYQPLYQTVPEAHAEESIT